MKKREKIFWCCFVICGLVVAYAWINFIENRSLSSGILWVLSLTSAVVPAAAFNLSSRH